MFTLATVASILIAAGCVAYAWRVRRDDRARSAARVSALAAAIEGTSVAAPGRPVISGGADTLFGRDPGSVVHGRPLLKVAAGFAMAVAIIVVIAMAGDRQDRLEMEAGAEESSESLELLSMRHERVGDDLTVTGLVRNPGAAAPGAMMAVVFAFDRDGGFVASGRAPLEFATIAAGDESPFQVVVPDVKDVGRYRVSFRTTAGVVRHVDRRPATAAAAAERPNLQVSTN